MLLHLILALAQDAPQAPPPVETVLYPSAIEAPTQPTGRSSSAVRRTDRFAPTSGLPLQGELLTPIASLVAVRGQESNPVSGVGLVTGLAGTGDSIEGARQLLKNLLLTRNINLDLQALSSKNVAIVLVEAELPAGIKPGRRIDARVSTIGDASSLQGGVLTLTELTDITGTVVYATASGGLTVGGFQAEGEGATATKNQVTVGRIPGGGKVEREVPTSIVSEHGYLYLDIRQGQEALGNVVRIAERINELYPGVALAQDDAMTVRVQIPGDLPESAYAAYLHSILRQEVQSEDLARVIVNERSGVIVMGGDVRLRPGAIAHGNLTVTIAETPEASQPGPLSKGETQVLDRTQLDVEEENNALVMVPGAATLQEVVDVLNVLGTTPRDMISILDAMSLGGLLVAEIRQL